MRCERCHGGGKIGRFTRPGDGIYEWIGEAIISQIDPCPECGGSGIIACCDGLVAQRIEQRPSKPQAGGSSPPELAKP
jgi:hypothetical protein